MNKLCWDWHLKKVFQRRNYIFRPFSGNSLVMRIPVTQPQPQFQLGPAVRTSGHRRHTMAVQTSANLTGNNINSPFLVLTNFFQVQWLLPAAEAGCDPGSDREQHGPVLQHPHNPSGLRQVRECQVSHAKWTAHRNNRALSLYGKMHTISDD